MKAFFTLILIILLSSFINSLYIYIDSREKKCLTDYRIANTSFDVIYYVSGQEEEMNIATIEDNKITMPSNDVVLEPVFEEIVLGATIEKILENPSTGVFNTICYVLGAFIIVSLIGYRIIKKKKMFKKL